METLSCAGCEDCTFSKNDVPSKLPIHEIHLYVLAKHLEAFRVICGELQLKPLVVELNGHQGSSIHVMASKRLVSVNDKEVMDVALSVKNDLIARGLDVYRIKIETNPYSVERDWFKGYFETHLAFKLHPWQRSGFERILRQEVPEARVSQNIFKAIDETSFILMATVRRTGISLEDFTSLVESYKKKLAAKCFAPEKVILEFCWFDDSLKSDENWI